MIRITSVITIFFTFILIDNVCSQSFTFTRISPELVVLNDTDYAVHSYAKLNPNSGTMNISIVRIIEDLTPAWDTLGTSICNYEGCFPNNVDTVTSSYNSNSADDTITVYFYCASIFPLPYGTFLHGAGHVRLKAFATSNPSQYIELDFRACTWQTIGIKQISSIVKEFSLGQNYPNPFNPNTKINFSLLSGNYSILKVYDILGREVKTLVNEFLLPGEYEVDFDAKDLSSGMYYYSLRSGDFVSVKKMVLVK